MTPLLLYPYNFNGYNSTVPSNRKLVFANNEIYHILNRSIGDSDIFIGKKELSRAVNLIDYYRFPQKIKFSSFNRLSVEARKLYVSEYKKQIPFVDIHAYAFIPNHFHLLLKQIKDNGIVRFASNFQNSFAKYFNKKNDRAGSLFMRPFRGKWIQNDEIYTHVSRYIHLNPVTSFIIEFDKLSSYPGTSFPIYMGEFSSGLINTEFLLKIFGSREKYKKFVADQVNYQRSLQRIKNLTLE